MRLLDAVTPLPFQGGLDLPGAVAFAAVAPDRAHVAGDRIRTLRPGMPGHPVTGGAGNARYPASRRYRVAGGVGPYHACLRANTGAACSETSTSISNCLLRLPGSTGSFRPGVRLSAARAEPLSRMPWTQRRGSIARCRTRPDLPGWLAALARLHDLPFERLVVVAGMFRVDHRRLQSHVIRPSSEGLIHCSQSTSAAQRSYLMYRSMALSRCSLLYFAIRGFSSRSGSPRKRHHLDALKRKVSCGSYEMRMKT